MTQLDITGYVLRYGKSATEALSLEPVAIFSTEDSLSHVFEGDFLPTETTHLLVFAVRESGEDTTPLYAIQIAQNGNPLKTQQGKKVSFSFSDRNEQSGFLEGPAVLAGLQNEIGLGGYVLRWGKNAQEALENPPLTTFPLSPQEYSAGTLRVKIPEDATRLLVFLTNQLGAESFVPNADFEIIDYSPKKAVLSFSDSQEMPGLLTGQGKIIRRDDESGILSYSLRWSDQAGNVLNPENPPAGRFEVGGEQSGDFSFSFVNLIPPPRALSLSLHVEDLWADNGSLGHRALPEDALELQKADFKNPRLGLDFQDENKYYGLLEGKATFEKLAEEKGISGYSLHWGESTSDKFKASSSLITQGVVSQEELTHQFSSTPIPHGASHLLGFVNLEDGREVLAFTEAFSYLDFKTVLYDIQNEQGEAEVIEMPYVVKDGLAFISGGTVLAEADAFGQVVEPEIIDFGDLKDQDGNTLSSQDHYYEPSSYERVEQTAYSTVRRVDPYRRNLPPAGSSRSNSPSQAGFSEPQEGLHIKPIMSFIPSSVGDVWTAAIPFEIGGGFTADQKALIKQAIAIYEEKTNLRFQEQDCTPGLFNRFSHVYFKTTENSTSSSSLGRVFGRNSVSLHKNDTGDAFLSTAIHEIGHAVGLFHEQARKDRNNTVTINFNNIHSDNHLQFGWFTNSPFYIDQKTFFSPHGPYDLDSVMHYRVCTMSVVDGCSNALGDVKIAWGVLNGEFKKEKHEKFMDLLETLRTKAAILPIPGNFTVDFDTASPEELDLMKEKMSVFMDKINRLDDKKTTLSPGDIATLKHMYPYPLTRNSNDVCINDLICRTVEQGCVGIDVVCNVLGELVCVVNEMVCFIERTCRQIPLLNLICNNIQVCNRECQSWKRNTCKGWSTTCNGLTNFCKSLPEIACVPDPLSQCTWKNRFGVHLFDSPVQGQNLREDGGNHEP